ncbi:hypothetical protein [Dermacoccus barathri]|uniref:Uncharacterized protein n=1 Tax=Dermacoccus barathri TaxID=322601 RepID=A0ABN2B628_9MICO
MASHDAGWDAFRSELRHWMELRHFTSRALAMKLNDALGASSDVNLDEHVVKRWRHSTAPPLAAVRHIAAILEMSDDPTGAAPHDPTFILRRMGLLDEPATTGELVDSSFRLQELRLRLLDVRASLGEHSARSGAGRLVQTAMSHGYAAAVYPVWAGPVGYPMHVSDRIDFRPARPGLGSIDDVPAMRSLFVENFAVPGQLRPRFSTHSDDLDAQEHWAIPHIGRPSTRSGHMLHLAVPSIAVSAQTTRAWVDDVASMLAWVLGYGFVSTREIARELTRNPFATEALRNDVHEQFLTQAPARHVWSHHAAGLPSDNPGAPWTDASGAVASSLVHVRLVETDAVLEHESDWLAEQLGTTEEEAAVLAKRDRDEAASRLDSPTMQQGRHRVVTVPVELLTDASDRWEQVFQTVLLVTHRLHELGVKVDLYPIHERLARDEPDIAPTILRWLADHGSPLVSEAFSSSHHLG